ncbi:hypothetical protein AH04_8 [Erwinia phage AH04]|uniref:Uncharacterized protein n=1 Tax=Erwinia phage AH04 TaxID=2869569 RepID=A0AAE8BQ08_9CAUD|nr:hypothetical protein PQC02_gp008 [Erwinia phage AH04]QZA70498.1 hypothetical protein AH04_8 [Erwinia phage AH04]
MKLPSHIIHTLEFSNCDKLAETKLPDDHSRQERISEIKQLAKKYQGVPGMFLYVSFKLEQLNGFTDEFYQEWVKLIKEIEATEEKGIALLAIPENELPKDVHGNKADLETHSKSPEHKLLEKQICGLTNAPDFTMSEKDHTTFLQIVKGMTFEAGTSEMALAFITVAIMDKDKLIIERDKREEDFPVLINIIVDIYRHASDAKSTLLLTKEALERHINHPDVAFKLALFSGVTSFKDVIHLVRKPNQPQLSLIKE